MRVSRPLYPAQHTTLADPNPNPNPNLSPAQHAGELTLPLTLTLTLPSPNPNSNLSAAQHAGEARSRKEEAAC